MIRPACESLDENARGKATCHIIEWIGTEVMLEFKSHGTYWPLHIGLVLRNASPGSTAM